MADNPTDPPMTPQDGTIVWFETPPSALNDDPALAVLIAASLKEYDRNEMIVWVESHADGHPVHRLASDVLVHALLPTTTVDEESRKRGLTAALENVSNATNIVIEFFTASTFGYFRVCSAVRHERSTAEG